MQTTSKRKMQTGETAASVYKSRFSDCKNIIGKIAKALEAHKGKQMADSRNWGFAGDLDEVRKQLAYALASLGDRSAVNEHGLKY